MALTTPGKYEDALLDAAGNGVPGAVVTVPSGYTAVVDSFGNLTVTGPPSDTVSITITPPNGAAVTRVVQVRPTVTELAGDIETAQAAADAAVSGLATKVNTSTYTAGLAAKLDSSVASATFLSAAPGTGLTEGATLDELAAEAERATLAEQANATKIAGTAGHVVYGTGAVPARPTGYALVVWRGTADPAANAAEGDEWVGP